jgi:hypothetical protein
MKKTAQKTNNKMKTDKNKTQTQTTQAKAIQTLEELEKFVNPEVNKLKINEDDSISAIIMDEELDEYLCHFNNDGCVEINVENSKYIVLSVETLRMLANLIIKAEKKYDALS